MANKKRFALVGAGGYIAPKHLKAIKDTGNELTVAVDRHDSVGIIDSYFPDASFFTEFERFDRFLEKKRHDNSNEAIDYVSICSPNYLHDAHCRLALRVGADAICEKPLVVNPWNIDQLQELEQLHGRKVNAVLQLRLHEAVIDLKAKAELSDNRAKKPEILLTYITRRGRWYHHSWKGDESRSGGLPLNIGVHFFDFLTWIFGEAEKTEIHLAEPSRYSGTLELEKANVKWFLSVDASDLPTEVVANGGYAYRSITCDGEEIDLSKGFTDLHTRVYEEILAGQGHGLEDARGAIDLVYKIRQQEVSPPGPTAHPKMLG
ncbi:MAG: Gfo/Idh/MocA family oxidoreductase [Mariniblastus sp.]